MAKKRIVLKDLDPELLRPQTPDDFFDGQRDQIYGYLFDEAPKMRKNKRSVLSSGYFWAVAAAIALVSVLGLAYLLNLNQPTNALANQTHILNDSTITADTLFELGIISQSDVYDLYLSGEISVNENTTPLDSLTISDELIEYYNEEYYF